MTTLDAMSRVDIAVRLAGSSAERAAFLRDAAEQGHAKARPSMVRCCSMG